MKKYLFVDRDGTLIYEPSDFQIDSVEKFELLPNVISSLKKLQNAGFELVMVTNQDGLGSLNYPQEKFDLIQKLLLNILKSESISFNEILICPHKPEDLCLCRKPQTQLLYNYLSSSDWDRKSSAVIGDRKTDLDLANNLGVRGFQLGPSKNWREVTHLLIDSPRISKMQRVTKETKISMTLDLDGFGQCNVKTGLGFFDHMLEQVALHGKLNFCLQAEGDLHIDEHHLVEDVAILFGQAVKKALGGKQGIERYGSSSSQYLPMDESLAFVSLDLCGRPTFIFDGHLGTDKVGGLSSFMVKHFFKSFSDSVGASLHMKISGENPHHMVEALFKSFGRCLALAVARGKNNHDQMIPSTKGLL